MAKLFYLGKRRPSSLVDQGNYREADAKARATTPKPQKRKAGVAGFFLGNKGKGRGQG